MTLIILSQCRKDEPIPNVIIHDNNFLIALVELGVDRNGDGKISQTEAESVKSLDLSSKEISDMTGIENFTNLDSLDCSRNDLTFLNVSKNTSLEYLDCHYNKLSSLDVSAITSLDYLHCGSNELTNLDISNNPNLGYLYCGHNQLTNLDVTSCTNLDYFVCWNN